MGAGTHEWVVRDEVSRRHGGKSGVSCEAKPKVLGGSVGGLDLREDS